MAWGWRGVVEEGCTLKFLGYHSCSIHTTAFCTSGGMLLEKASIENLA